MLAIMAVDAMRALPPPMGDAAKRRALWEGLYL
jgi:hypothetical protein